MTSVEETTWESSQRHERGVVIVEGGESGRGAGQGVAMYAIKIVCTM